MIRKTTTAIALALLWAPAQGFLPGSTPGVCFSKAVSSPYGIAAMSASETNDGSFLADFDWEAYEKKNASRKKFGLKPITPEQFLETQAQVQQLTLQQEQKKAELQQQRAQQEADKMTQSQGLVPGFLEKMFGSDTCESNFDCERPQVCCDFGFTRKCCSSGTRQRSREGELAYVPVPVDIQDYPSYY